MAVGSSLSRLVHRFESGRERYKINDLLFCYSLDMKMGAKTLGKYRLGERLSISPSPAGSGHWCSTNDAHQLTAESQGRCRR